MALNPQLMLNGMPIPFVNEMFVLVRDGVEFEVDKIPGGHGGHVKAKGVIYLSNIRLVFVASKPVENFVAFDMPLLYIHAEKFNQPIFHCNNISGQRSNEDISAAAIWGISIEAASLPFECSGTLMTYTPKIEEDGGIHKQQQISVANKQKRCWFV